MDFRKPDLERFPCLRLAFEAMEVSGTSPTVLNAANEIAVQSFLQKTISYVQIAEVIQHVMSEIPSQQPGSLQTIIAVDEESRHAAQDYINLVATKSRVVH